MACASCERARLQREEAARKLIEQRTIINKYTPPTAVPQPPQRPGVTRTWRGAK